MSKDLKSSFVVGQVFCHNNPDGVMQYHRPNFVTTILAPCREKVIAINFDGITLDWEYRLPCAMTDRELRETTDSMPMTLDEFWLILYALIIEPNLGKEYLKYELTKKKYYIFQFVSDTGMWFSAYVAWIDNAWRLGSPIVNEEDTWEEGKILIHLI